MSISAKLFASGKRTENIISLVKLWRIKAIFCQVREVKQKCIDTEFEKYNQEAARISPLSLLSLCSLLLLLSTSSPMKITTMPTNTQEMVTIIFKPSPPPEFSSLTLGAFIKGAMVPVQKLHVLGQITVASESQISQCLRTDRDHQGQCNPLMLALDLLCCSD